MKFQYLNTILAQGLNAKTLKKQIGSALQGSRQVMTSSMPLQLSNEFEISTKNKHVAENKGDMPFAEIINQPNYQTNKKTKTSKKTHFNNEIINDKNEQTENFSHPAKEKKIEDEVRGNENIVDKPNKLNELELKIVNIEIPFLRDKEIDRIKIKSQLNEGYNTEKKKNTKIENTTSIKPDNKKVIPKQEITRSDILQSNIVANKEKLPKVTGENLNFHNGPSNTIEFPLKKNHNTEKKKNAKLENTTSIKPDNKKVIPKQEITRSDILQSNIPARKEVLPKVTGENLNSYNSPSNAIEFSINESHNTEKKKNTKIENTTSLKPNNKVNKKEMLPKVNGRYLNTYNNLSNTIQQKQKEINSLKEKLIKLELKIENHFLKHEKIKKINLPGPPVSRNLGGWSIKERSYFR